MTLDREWLRHRIYPVTQRRLAGDEEKAYTRGVRVLLVVAPTAIEPIRVRGKIH